MKSAKSEVKATKSEGKTALGALAIEVGMLLSVLVCLAVVVYQAPLTDDDTAFSAGARAAAPADARPYYFPSQFDIIGTDAGGVAPTF
ncbi:MAG: hypothetical protein ABJC33_05540 [Betaproteobacteria bacterium]